MAWQASSAWKKSLPKASSDDSSFPGLKPTTSDATTKIEYEELQQNELLALEAIYGDDFVKHSDVHSAWKVKRTTTRTDSSSLSILHFLYDLHRTDSRFRRQSHHSKFESKHPSIATLP